MSSPFTSLNKYRKLPLNSKVPIISSNDTPYDEKYKKKFSLLMIEYMFSATPISQHYRYTSKKKNRNLVYRVFILIDEDSQLLDEVTSRMAMDNIKTNRTMNDSRIRGLNKIINQFL